MHEKLDFTPTIRAIKAFREPHPGASGIYTENRANPAAAVNTLSQQVPGTNQVSPSKSKYDPKFASSDELNAGNFYLPHPQLAPWVEAFLCELSAFPRGKHDDWLHAWTQAREVLSGAGTVDYRVLTSALRVAPFSILPPGLRPSWDP